MFCDRMDVEKPQRVPPFSFSALWDVSAPGARASEPRRATRSSFLVCNFFKKKFSKNFRFSTTVKEYLTLGSLFAIFEPWIWRRLGPVPACFVFSQKFLLSPKGPSHLHFLIFRIIQDFQKAQSPLAIFGIVRFFKRLGPFRACFTVCKSFFGMTGRTTFDFKKNLYAKSWYTIVPNRTRKNGFPMTTASSIIPIGTTLNKSVYWKLSEVRSATGAYVWN